MESIELSSWAESVPADKIPIALAQLAAAQTSMPQDS